MWSTLADSTSARCKSTSHTGGNAWRTKGSGKPGGHKSVFLVRIDSCQHRDNLGTYHLGQNDYSFDALQAYCFGFYFRSVSVIILAGMVWQLKKSTTDAWLMLVGFTILSSTFLQTPSAHDVISSLTTQQNSSAILLLWNIRQTRVIHW